MFGLKFVAFDTFAAGLGIRRVEAQAMFAGDERKCLSEIAAQFVRCSSFARIIARDSQPAAESSVRIFKAADIVALPTMQGNGNARKVSESFADINAELGVAFLCEV